MLTQVLFAFLVSLVAMLAPGIASAQSGNSGFDHLTTGFPLNGLHADVRCETCHIKGIFKSTPRDCAVCHVQGNPRGAVAKPVNHLPSALGCDACHSTSTFGGARFDHVLADPGSCRTCHNGVIAKGKTANHVPTVAPCSDCHTTISFAALAKPAGHIPTLASSRCESCHTSLTVGGTYAGAQMDHTGYTSNCAQCHAPAVASTFLGVQIRSSATSPPHVPSSDSCETCHTSVPAMLIPTSGAASVGGTTFAGGRMSHAGITSNCVLCHGPNVVAGSFIGVTPKTNVGLVPPHLPVSNTCESCHANAIPAQLIPATGAASIGATTFANGQMSHAGITSGCASCHGPSINGTSFFGISSIVVQPPTSPMGTGSHIPSGTTCEQCHLAAVPASLVAPNATRTPPGTGFATPAPTAAQIHSGITSGCSSCHEAASVWMGMSAYPIAPTVKTTGAQYTGFQTRPRAAAGTFNVADASHPASGDCSQCHSGTNSFSGQDKPANHIPTAATAQCTACHTTSPVDYSVMPTLANIHANAPSTTGNCAQCHGAAAASFAIPAANFSIVGLPGNHIPTPAACESCHVGAGSSITSTPVGNGARFSGSLMNHAGITNNCAACHVPAGTSASFAGIASIVVQPPTSPMGAGSHIPSSTTCENCHAGTLANVGGLIAANASQVAPGTKFQTPAPSGAQIHAGVTSGCASCHEASSVWMGMSAYPIAPTVKTTGAQYTGFQTRPRAAAGTFNVADASHPASGDCSQCHSGTNFFSGQDKPANHIPYAASAQCTACHTTTDFSVMPTLANIHANAPSTTTNCAQCHGAAAASFAIPAANFSIVGLPGNHIPTSVACESCHVGTGSSVPVLPVPNGAKFSGSRMSHAGITNNCAACHAPSGTSANFAGITAIVGMPPTSPMGAGSHIPSSTTCESCHAGTLANVSGLIAASATRTAPGTLFATPAPTTAQIHAGVTSGCSSCHEASSVWMGMSAYPIAPTVMTSGAQYTGFHTRPRAAAGTFNVADAAHPAAGDCSNCHTGTNFFSGQAKPAGHIPTNQPCTTCHVGGSDFSIAGLTTNMATLHTGISSGCASCHTAGTGAGPFAGCTTQATCASPPPLTYQPKMMPLAAGGSPTAPSKLTHVPVGAVACEKCHSPTVFTSFAGMNMKGNTTAHNSVSTATCMSCHEGGPPAYTWFGVTIVTRPVGHQGRKAGQDCVGSGCHNRTFTQFNAALIRPVLRTSRITSNPRLLPGGTLTPDVSIGRILAFDHQGVLPGQCVTCHNGVAARGLPVKHLATKTSCDTCHRTTAWRPAQFSHQGVVAGQCTTCHNANAATGKSSSHFLTARSCDACHRTLSWQPVSYSHLSPAYRPAADKPTCISCHVTNGEMIPRMMHGNPRVRPIPVPPGP